MAKRKRDEAIASHANGGSGNTSHKSQPPLQPKAIRGHNSSLTLSKSLNPSRNGTSMESKTAQNQSPPAKIQKRNNHVDARTELSTIQIIIGSYERALHGITASMSYTDDQLKTSFADSFLFNAHASAVRCLALSPMPEDASQGVYLASGGSDERVNVYSLSAAPMPDADSKGRKVPTIPSLGPNKISENPMNRELGTLVQHSSSVTALQFPSRSKLLSASEDNTISITRVRDLEVISTVKAPHPKVSGQASGDSGMAGTVPAGINDFAVHPSMKLMVSVGRGERSMRLWNLVTGKKAGVLNFERKMLQAVKEGKYSHGEGRKIRWNTGGAEFAIAFERGVVVFGQDSKAKCVLMPQQLTKVHQVAYFTVGGREFIAVSTDDGNVLFFDSTKADAVGGEIPVQRPFAYVGGKEHGITSRIKDFQILQLAQEDEPDYLLVVGCSNGDIRLITIAGSDLLQPKTDGGSVGKVSTDVYSTGSRITCLVAFVMLPAHNVDGGLSEAESSMGSEVDSDDSSE